MRKLLPIWDAPPPKETIREKRTSAAWGLAI